MSAELFARGGARGGEPGRRAAVLVVAVFALAATAALSQVRYGRPADALVRLSWRARGVRVEECRHPSAEELARLPQHMRQAEICEGRITPFVLRLVVDGGLVVMDTIRAAGAREDRPIYVFRESTLEPGEHDVELTFERVQSPAGRTGAAPPADSSQSRFPASLALRARLRLEAGDIALITYDEDSRALVRRESPSR